MTELSFLAELLHDEYMICPIYQAKQMSSNQFCIQHEKNSHAFSLEI